VNLLQRLRSSGGDEQRYSLEDYAQDVTASLYFGGAGYTGQPIQTYGKPGEKSDDGFAGRVSSIYKRNGVVFAVQAARLMVFTEARFMWQQLRAGRPQDLFWTPELLLLETPWVNGSTGELLARMIQDVDLAGNAYIRRTDPTARTAALERLRPDWTTIILGSNDDLINSEVVGYLYEPGGPGSGRDPIVMAREEVAHWAPIPDPTATYRGMSWMTPVLREVRGDSASTDHKIAFFDHAATPNMVVKFDASIAPEKAEKFKAMLEGEHRSFINAWKTLYLGGGADATVVGSSFKDMDYRSIQAAGETRIAAAAGTPPIIVGLSEGLESATYSNYGQAKRRFADMTIRPLWRSCSAALSTVVSVPERARLWYDDRDIPALQEDQEAAARIQQTRAETIRALVQEGFDPDSVVKAVLAEDFSLLKHTGKVSVQLKEPGSDAAQPAAPAA
jgi:phage portal protein BeeE